MQKTVVQLNQVVLYDKGECPFCWKIRLSLYYKGIVFQEHRVDTDNKPPELLKLNPAGKVPVLLIDNLVLTESTLVMLFLEDVKPNPSLLEGDPAQRHKARQLNYYADTIIGPRIRDAIFEKRGKPEKDWDWSRIRAAEEGWRLCLRELAEQLGENRYFAGKYGVAECALLPRFGLALAYGLPGLEDYPNLARWFAEQSAETGYRETAPAVCQAVDP